MLTTEDATTMAAASIKSNVPVVDLAAALEPTALAAWLEHEYALHAASVTALLAAYDRFLIATQGGITEEDIAGRATDFARQLKAEQRDTDATRTKIKAPVLHAQRMIDGEAKALTDRLANATSVVEQRIGVFLAAKAERERKAAEEAAQQAALAAHNAMLAADALHTSDAVDAAVLAVQEAQRAEAQAMASLPELSRTRSAHGGLSGLKDNWVYEITSTATVPVHYLTVNDAAVKLAIKQGARDIPGLRIWNDAKVYVR